MEHEFTIREGSQTSGDTWLRVPPDEAKPMEIALEIADLAIATGHPRRTLNIAREIVEIRDNAEQERARNQQVKELEEAGYPV